LCTYVGGGGVGVASEDAAALSLSAMDDDSAGSRDLQEEDS
jgi:hypothetical protein